MKYTRNHIVIEDSTGGCRLTISQYLRAQMGQASSLRFVEAGARVDCGEPFGIIAGRENACHLYAPFPITVDAVGADIVQAHIDGPPCEALLERAEYDAYVAALD